MFKLFCLAAVLACMALALGCILTGSPWSALTCACSGATIASMIDDDDSDELDLDTE